MQSKGAISLLGILMALACIYQLSFTLVTRNAENKAREASNGDPVAYQTYLDSIANEPVYNIFVKEYTFLETKERELNLGLDLRGGMNVTLEVSVVDLLRSLSNNSTDPTFNKAIDEALQMQKNSQKDFVTLFGEAFTKVDPNAKLAAVFSTMELQDRISFGSTNEQVLAVIREEADNAISRSFNILRTRIDKFGVTQPNIQQLGSGKILVELPGVKEPNRVRKLLQGTAKLEFWETWNNDEVISYLEKVNEQLRKTQPKSSNEAALADSLTASADTVATQDTTQKVAADTAKSDTTDLLAEIKKDTTGALKDTANTFENFAKENPLYAVLSPAIFQNTQGQQELQKGPVVGYAAVKDTAKVNAIFARDDIRAMLPKNMRFLWGVKPPTKEATVHEMIAIKTNGRDNKAPLDGSAISDARQDFGQFNGKPEITMRMNAEGAQVWKRLTAENVGKSIAIVLDDYVYSYPTVQGEIAGGFYYSNAGWAADVALFVNIFFIFGVLASLGAVLTLPGIAGIVLTLALAVDANIIIYERIREELANGKGTRLAVADGYKMAYSSIIDANVTSILSGIILYVFGSGPIQGFATTLIIGILISMFTAIFITRIIFEWRLDRNKAVNFSTKLTENAFKNINVDWISGRKLYYTISAIIIVIGIGSMLVRGFSTGVDFNGGRTYVVRFDQDVNSTEIREKLATPFGSAPEVKMFGPSNQVKVTTTYMINDNSTEADAKVESALVSGLGIKADQIMSSQKVGPTIADDLKVSSAYAVLFSLIVIFLYIVVRFRKWAFGTGAVVALAHDVLITLGLFSLLWGVLPFSLEIDQAFIAAILTVVGYSINDTVIVFDRVRENLALHEKWDLKETLNKSLNSTLSRTINTSLTIFFVLMSIFIFGGEVIRGFTFALLIGIIVGTYSSLCIASPIVYDFLSRKKA